MRRDEGEKRDEGVVCSNCTYIVLRLVDRVECLEAVCIVRLRGEGTGWEGGRG